MHDHKLKWIYWLCLSVVIMVPFSNDVYISGFPEMKIYFSTTHIGWVLSVFLLGLAIVQPCYGPISNHFGRKPVLLGGLLIYILGSATCVK